MTTARRIFSATVTLPAATATSVASLMQSSILHWGLESDLISPSMDSFTGSELGLTPDATTYVGRDSNVRNADADPLYKGVTVVSGQNYSLQDFGGAYGLIDPQQVWLYSTPGANIALVFQGR